MKIGDRVGAVFGTNEDGSIDFLGYGIYEGKFVPIEAVGQLSEMMREIGRVNPRIRMDSGSVVYGCECWWGSEESIKKTLDGQTVNPVSINAVRDKFKVSP